MAGYWLNFDTGKCIRVGGTHDEWIRDKANADGIGLPQAGYAAIMKYSSTAIDEIRLTALHWGLVRIREHRRNTSVQFAAHPHQVTSILQAVVAILRSLTIHPDTMLVIDNLLLTDSVRISLREVENALANDQPVLRKQSDIIPDVPINHPMLDEIRRRAQSKEG